MPDQCTKVDQTNTFSFELDISMSTVVITNKMVVDNTDYTQVALLPNSQDSPTTTTTVCQNYHQYLYFMQEEELQFKFLPLFRESPYSN